MFKNYFYLRRSVFELNSVLSGATITEIYSQEKNILFLSIPSDDFPFRHLLISANPQSPFLLVRNAHHKAKRNVVHFFSNIRYSKIKSIRIAESDRIVNIELLEGNIQFKILGNKTNIFLRVNENVEYFKKCSELITKENIGLNFSDSIDYEVLDNDNIFYDDIVKLKKAYPMISSEIKNELILRINESNKNSISGIFKEIINEILKKKICVGFSTMLNKTIFIPETFHLVESIESKKYFSDFNSALQYYISSDHKENNKSDLNKELENYFDKELSILATKLNKLSTRIEDGSKELEYSNYGNILLTNIYKITKGMSEITLDDNTDEKQVTIKLNPKFNTKQNIDRYFEKSRDEKLNYQKSIELFNLTEKKYNDILDSKKIFLNLKRVSEIEELYKKVIPQKEKIIKMETGLKFKYWHYLVDDLYNVYVGRDSKSNDYLSVKFAKQNDYWFHARGLPGSHVVLRVENVKEGIPKPIIKKAASIAAFHSKAKTAGTAPVSYTFAKFVYKKKGMAPGKVILTKENTLLVKPEIPKNCELISE
jgi:predicted ribosome quality control (RQC) complex YloA/Tae2 family protein